MSYNITIVQKSSYLHAIVTGANTRENVSSYIEDLRRDCSFRGCPRVLIEERLEGPRLNTMDVFQIVSHACSHAPMVFTMIAYVDINAQGDTMQFAETVAVNRGVNVRVFPTVHDAEQWLLEKA